MANLNVYPFNYLIMKISGKQKKRLWGYSNEKLPYGPYSEVQIITETRIIDDHVSRTMMFVEAHINPLTFEIVTANADKFDERDAIE
ncbi:MAG: hypothetical protein LBD75_05020 [Candidatus Peribacteria bacterium]|nr:hypothetical protein [Candidatus Peribacteria bacterium]